MSQADKPFAAQNLTETPTNCPIPSTHDKFNEAQYFFGQMLQNYHFPWQFQFNLNAFIQALRNVTFMLQAEPNKPEGFDGWYAAKREELKVAIGHKIPPFADTRDVLQRATGKDGLGFVDEEHIAIGEQMGVERTWRIEELGHEEVVAACLKALNFMGSLVAEAHRLYGLKDVHEDIRVDLRAVQVLLETDVDPSLLEKWGW